MTAYEKNSSWNKNELGAPILLKTAVKEEGCIIGRHYALTRENGCDTDTCDK